MRLELYKRISKHNTNQFVTLHLEVNCKSVRCNNDCVIFIHRKHWTWNPSLLFCPFLKKATVPSGNCLESLMQVWTAFYGLNQVTIFLYASLLNNFNPTPFFCAGYCKIQPYISLLTPILRHILRPLCFLYSYGEHSLTQPVPKESVCQRRHAVVYQWNYQLFSVTHCKKRL